MTLHRLNRETHSTDWELNIKAAFDKIVGWFKGYGTPSDNDYIPPGPAPRRYHFTIGEKNGDISGGIYIKLGVPRPSRIVIELPDPWEHREQTKGE